MSDGKNAECILLVYLLVLYPKHSSHADGESETDETTERDEVKSSSDRVQEAELLVCLVHSGGWLISAYSPNRVRAKERTHVSLVVFLTLQLLQPMPLKHNLGSLRTEPDQVQQLRNQSSDNQQSLPSFLGRVPVWLCGR